MKVLLVDPAGPQRFVTHNVGLAFLSRALIARGHDVRVLDLNNYEYTNEEVAQYALTYRPDWIGVSVKTALVSSAERTMRAIRNKWDRARTIIGGPHVGVLGTTYMAGQDLYEFGLAGEGELAFPDLVDGKKVDTISGLIFRNHSGWQANPIDFINDLDSLEYPTYRTWDRISRSLFPYLMVHSRGCPYRCGFCSVPKLNGRNFRKRSPEGIIEELRYARKEYVFRNFEFIDDNLTLDIEHAKRLCEALIRADLGIGWYANNGIRADRLDPELARLMKRSGCKGVAIGVESADDEILRNIHKGETVQQMAHGIQLLHEAGITVGGHFIVGLPGDTLEKFKRSLRFKEEVRLDYAYFNQLVPYPGTEVGNWAQRHGKILVENITDASHFGKTEILMETPEFPKADRELAQVMLAADLNEGSIEFSDFKSLYAGQSRCKVLVIRSGRMDPYHHILSLLPDNSTLDVLVSKGIRVSDQCIQTVYEYPHSGLMRLTGLSRELKKKLLNNYDLAIYINTLQTGLSFDNVVTIARHSAEKVYEYQAGKQLRLIKKTKCSEMRSVSVA